MLVSDRLIEGNFLLRIEWFRLPKKSDFKKITYRQ
jgi:hypothetical protein